MCRVTADFVQLVGSLPDRAGAVRDVDGRRRARVDPSVGVMNDRNAKSHPLPGHPFSGDLQHDAPGQGRSLALAGCTFDACVDSRVDRLRQERRAGPVAVPGLAAGDLIARLLTEWLEGRGGMAGYEIGEQAGGAVVADVLDHQSGHAV